MKVQFSTRSKRFRLGVACAAAAVAGPVALAAMPATAGATDGTTQVICVGALDDTNAVYTESVGWMSTYAALYGGGGPATGVPSSWPSVAMSYSLTGLPESVAPTAGALPVSFTWGGDAAVTDAITDWLEPYLGMTAAAADPVVTTVKVTGPATVTGLTRTTAGTIPLDPSAAAAPVTVSGTVTPTGTGSLNVSATQRITLVIGKDINVDSRAFRVETLTFDCATAPLPAVYVISPGAPLARIDDFTSTDLTVDADGAVSGKTTFDVLANDEATASALDPASLTVVDSGPLTTSVVDGKIVVTGTTDPAGWIDDRTIADCLAIDQSSQTSATGTETTIITVYSCTATVEYSVCTVDQPPLCSTTQAMIPFTKNDVQTSTPEVLPISAPAPATPVPASPTYTG